MKDPLWLFLVNVGTLCVGIFASDVQVACSFGKSLKTKNWTGKIQFPLYVWNESTLLYSVG